MKLHLFAVIGVCALGACAPTIKDAVYNEKIAGSEGVKFDGTAADAKIRMVWTPEVLRGDGKRRVLCAEPSPDAFSQIAASFGLDLSANVAGKGGGEVSMQSTLTELAKTLGTRTVAIQLLRDGLYRLCEADINGRVGDFNYHIVQANMDQVMLRLVAIENISRAALTPVDATASKAISDARAARISADQEKGAYAAAVALLQTQDDRLRRAQADNRSAKIAQKGAEAEMAQITKDLAAKKKTLEGLDRADAAKKAEIAKLESDIEGLEGRNRQLVRFKAEADQAIAETGAAVAAITTAHEAAKTTVATALQKLTAAESALPAKVAAEEQAARKLDPAAVEAIKSIIDPENGSYRTVIAACFSWLAMREQEGRHITPGARYAETGAPSIIARNCEGIFAAELSKAAK